MKKKCLGRTGLMVTENSFGALPIQRISKESPTARPPDCCAMPMTGA